MGRWFIVTFKSKVDGFRHARVEVKAATEELATNRALVLMNSFWRLVSTEEVK